MDSLFIYPVSIIVVESHPFQPIAGVAMSSGHGGVGCAGGGGAGGGPGFGRVTLTLYSKISPKIGSVAPAPPTVAVALVTVTSEIRECDQTTCSKYVSKF
jgi:hypothetical protein